MDGGEGADQIEAGGGDDVMYGRNHNDVFEGEAGDDTMQGSNGADTLDGGKGSDLLIGAGNGDETGDTYVLSSGDNTIQGYKDGDEIILSQDLIEKGLSSKQVAVKRTTIDGKGAALLSFELEGQQQTTTVIGVNVAEFEELKKPDFEASAPSDELLTKLETTKLGSKESARKVVLPASSASYIDWGDGNVIEAQTSDLSHTYDKPGEYKIQAVFDLSLIHI